MDETLIQQTTDIEQKFADDLKQNKSTEMLIQYEGVEVHQQELCVLSNVNLKLYKGDFVYLVGKVGSGKTSLL